MRLFQDGRYSSGLGERFGSLTLRPTRPGGIWLHAVSVGEVLSAATLIGALREKFPSRPFYVSCSTIAGRELANRRLAGIADGVFYAPIDYCWIVRRVLRRLRPSAVIVLETEIWPNLWREAGRFGATLSVVNGRISDRAYPKYRRLAWFFKPVLTLPGIILTQSESDTARYRSLGAKQARTSANLKYDVVAPGPPPAEIADWVAGGALFIAASTMPPDEDDAVIRAFQALPSDTKLILAPRRPGEFDTAAEKLRAAGISFARRSHGTLDGVRCLLMDSMGELASLFALNSVVFVGGSLVPWGGHNVLEPALFGRPIVTGSHMHNFAAMFGDFRSAGALRVVRDAEELAAVVTELLRDPGHLGARAMELVAKNRGAAQKAAAAIDLGAPLTHRPVRWFWWMLSRLWLAGVAIDRRLTHRKRLGRPVVSVGGLAMGGSGKTPMVLWLAQHLHARGVKVGILTRGYRRRDRQPVSYQPGEDAPVELTGDEAKLFLAAGTAWVGIGQDRYLTGKLFEKNVDLFVLDDGFQHWALHRDLDIAVLDRLDPNAGGGVFPSGWLREGFDALERADFVVSPRKTIREAPPSGRYSAFCGIGNPASFRQTLREAGIEVMDWREFPDHHAYTLDDLKGLQPPIVTTEKDLMNLPRRADSVHVVKIGLDVENGAAILDRICLLIAER